MYATGFSMGCGKTWDMFEEYPEVFAALAPASALFSVTNNAFSAPLGDRLNKSIPVPFFYSGGEKSHLPELPFQSEDSLERVQYAVGVNRCKKKFDIDYSEKQNWENEIWGKEGDRSERYYDESRDSYLTVHYFDSEDGVCRTAFGSVDEQVHEFRHHSCECAWKFISQFTQENR